MLKYIHSPPLAVLRQVHASGLSYCRPDRFQLVSVTHISISLSLPQLTVQRVLTVSHALQIHSSLPVTLFRTFFPTCSQNILERSECARLTFSPVATGGTAAWKSAPGFKCLVPINQQLTVFQWGFVSFRVIYKEVYLRLQSLMAQIYLHTFRPNTTFFSLLL